MTDLDTPPAETRPLRAVVRFWPMSFALAFVGLVAGVGAGAGKPPIYTAETRLAIGAQGLSSYAIPGFALAAQELAADYARYVSLAQDGPALRTALGSRSAEIVGLSASPVPNSSVVSIEAESGDSLLAVKAVTAVGAALIAATNVQSNDQSAAALLKQYTALSTSVAQANQALAAAQTLETKLLSLSTSTPSQIAAAQTAEAQASTNYATLQLQQTALGNRYQSVATSTTPPSNLSVVQPATVIFNNTTKNEELYGLVGLAGGGAISLITATIRSRIVKRRRTAGPRKPRVADQPSEKPSYLADVIAHTGSKSSKKEVAYDELAPMPVSARMKEPDAQSEELVSAQNSASDAGSGTEVPTPKEVAEKNWARATMPPSSRFARPIAAPSRDNGTPPANGGSSNGDTSRSPDRRTSDARRTSSRNTETSGSADRRNTETSESAGDRSSGTVRR